MKIEEIRLGCSVYMLLLLVRKRRAEDFAGD